MTPEQIDRVFGRGRLKMMTGEHVEVYREAVAPGERRRYTKRFLDTGEGDFGQWTEREWRILARLIGHGIRCVPDVVQFDGGAQGGLRLVQTYDAGVTVDQWATLLPVARDGVVHRHVFEDCAHWWALAHHCLCALDEIHRLSLVHLDVKGDNICIPFGPANFDPDAPDARLYPIFPRLALIDFAFALVSRETLAAALPIGWQKDYDYQSPRLLAALEAGRAGDIEPTQELDWRCDFYSLAAMLKRYLPDEDVAHAPGAAGWSRERYADAKALIFRIRDAHDRNFPQWRPHQELASVSGAKLREPDLAASLDYGWTLARDRAVDDVAVAHTPLTRIAPTLATPQRSPIATRIVTPTAVTVIAAPRAVPTKQRRLVAHAVAASMIAIVAFAAPSQFGDPLRTVADDARALADAIRSRIAPAAGRPALAQAPVESNAPPADAAQRPIEPPPEPAAAGANEPTPPAQSEPPPLATAPAKTAPARAHASPRTQLAQAPAPRPRYPVPSTPQPPASAPKAHAKPMPPVHIARNAHATPVAPSKIAPPAATRVANAAPSAAAPLTQPAATAEPNPVVAMASPTLAQPEPAAPPAAAPATAMAVPVQPVAAPTIESPPPAPANEVAPIAPPRKPASPPPRAASNPPRQNDLRTQLSSLWRALRGRDQPPAPVEERSMQPPPAVASAAPRTAPRSSPPATTPPLVSSAPSWTSAPRTTPPRAEPSAPVANEPPVEELSALAHRLLAESVPRVAAQAHNDLERVLTTAALAPNASQESGIVEAARNSWASERMPIVTSMAQPTYARRLLDDARHTFASGGGVPAAIVTQTRAFGANPADADVASYLAFLYLRSSPPQAEAARELSLYAIAIRGSRRAGHLDDWHTFAIASALVGRDSDARNAFFIASAIGRNADRSCRTALSAYANYGERLRAPAEALIYRVNAQGKSWDSPYCTWPPDWSAVARWP